VGLRECGRRENKACAERQHERDEIAHASLPCPGSGYLRARPLAMAVSAAWRRTAPSLAKSSPRVEVPRQTSAIVRAGPPGETGRMAMALLPAVSTGT